jgi:hypothetical protein
MASSTRSEREEERRLNLRTLVIASGASALAAAVTSQLWIHGTWIAAALTPALVALISEAMHRPTERIARAWTTERPALDPRAAGLGEPVAPPHGDPLVPREGAAGLERQAPSEGRPPGAGAAGAGPVRVYRQPSDRSPRRRRFALGAVAATAAIGFVVAVVTLTAGDLVSGGSIGKGSGRTTLFSTNGGNGGNEAPKQETPANPAPDRTAPATPTTTGETPPATDTSPDQPTTDTAPVTPPSTPPGETAPDTVP